GLWISWLGHGGHSPDLDETKPKCCQAGRATPFLSRPAARPIGFGKVNPNRIFGFDGGVNRLSARSARSNCEALRSDAIVKWCAVSASSENNSGLTSRS